METNIEREVEEFRKKITSCTHVGGFHTCVISDPEDNEAYKERATNHFRDSLTRIQQETERKHLENLITIGTRLKNGEVTIDEYLERWQQLIKIN